MTDKATQAKTYTTEVAELPDGGLALPLNDECFAELDLQEGDKVKYTPIDNGYVISKWDGQLDLFFDVESHLGEVIDMEKTNG